MAEASNQPPKTGNIVQACDVCRVKKRKCDLKAGSRRCSSCIKSDSVCQVTHVTKPREKRKKKQMENLEDRLRSLEDLIKSSIAAKPSPSRRRGRTDAMTPSSLPSTTSSAEPVSWESDSLLADATPTPQAASFVQNLGLDAFQPSLSDISKSLATEIPQLTSEASEFWSPGGNPQFEVPAADVDTVNPDLRPQIRYNGTRKCSLPPAQGGLFLLQEYLVDFNTAVPLFDGATISALFLDCYNGRADGKVISWVALKVVLAIAHRLRAMSPLGVTQDTENVQTYLEESLAEMPSLLLMTPSLLLVQCLLGIAVVLSSSSRPQPAALLVSTALRVVQDLGVNHPPGSDNANMLDARQQQRVFWIAYYMDADMSLRAGRVPSLSPKLVNVEPPEDDELDSAGTINAAGGEFKINTFRLRVQLALLQAELMEYNQAPRSPPTHEPGDAASLQMIASKLDNWRQNWLFKIEVDNLRGLLHRSDLVHVLVLEAAYFSTAYALRVQMAPSSTARSDPFSADGLIADMSNEKAALSHLDARRFVGLLGSVSGEELPCNWYVVDCLLDLTPTLANETPQVHI